MKLNAFKCVLCKKQFPMSRANNAEPLKKGKCCNQCNTKVVFHRVMLLKEGK